MADVELKPVYLITGSDRPKVATALTRLRRHFVPESVERVSALEASAADAVALCNAGSLLRREEIESAGEDVCARR
jgi:DNA polymerase III delta subunit